MFSFFKRNTAQFFSPEQKQLITTAIQQAELQTSGEIRVYIESKCAYVNALDRAKEIFEQLNMHHTAQKNAVLVYVALKDKQLAVFGDSGIHQKLGDAYWKKIVHDILAHFNKNDYAEGIASTVRAIGIALQTHFPYDKLTDTNELPDDIVFGK